MSGYEETVKEREDEEIDLGILFRNFFQGLLRFWWLIAILMLVGGYGMYARATRFYTPRYRSTASFTVMTGDEDSGETYNFFYDVQSADRWPGHFPTSSAATCSGMPCGRIWGWRRSTAACRGGGVGVKPH